MMSVISGHVVFHLAEFFASETLNRKAFLTIHNRTNGKTQKYISLRKQKSVVMIMTILYSQKSTYKTGLIVYF